MGGGDGSLPFPVKSIYRTISMSALIIVMFEIKLTLYIVQHGSLILSLIALA